MATSDFMYIVNISVAAVGFLFLLVIGFMVLTLQSKSRYKYTTATVTRKDCKPLEAKDACKLEITYMAKNTKYSDIIYVPISTAHKLGRHISISYDQGNPLLYRIEWNAKLYGFIITCVAIFVLVSAIGFILYVM